QTSNALHNAIMEACGKDRPPMLAPVYPLIALLMVNVNALNRSIGFDNPGRGEDTSQPPPPPIASIEASQMVSSIKLLILKKGEYILWTMKMEQYLAHTDYALWKVILNERKAKSTLLMAIPDEHLARFHGIKDAKTLCAAIKTRFSAWSNISLIMRNKPGKDNLDIDDLYNNLKIYEADIKGSSGSSLNLQNVAFVSTESTNSTNDLNVVYSVSTATCHKEGTLPGIADQPGIQGTAVKMLGIQVEEEATDFALMAFTSNPSSSLSSNSEGHLRVHQQNEVIYEENIGVLEYDVKDKSNLLKYTQKQLDEALKEKEELKAKLEKFKTSSKNLTKLLDSQISAKVKTGLGYDSQFNEKEVLDVKEEAATETVFDNCPSDEENSLANDRFKKGEGYRTVSPPLTGNYMPPKSDLSFAGLDDSIYKPEHIPDKIDFVKSGESVKHVKPVKPVKTNVVPSGDLTCLFAKASIDESNLWHKRLSHVNFKSVNKLVKGNLVRGLPSKIFVNDHSCVACQKGKQHKATCKAKLVSSISQPLQMLHIDLFGPTSVAKAVNTACCVLNRVLVTKSHNKTSYELLNGRTPRLDFMRPFDCPVTILNTLDPLEKFEGKANEGFLVGYSVTSKDFKGFKLKNVGPQDTNGNASTQDNVDAGKEVSDQHYIVLPLWSSISSTFKSLDAKAADDKPKDDTSSKIVEEPVNKEDQAYIDELDRLMSQEKEASDAANAFRKEFKQGCMDQRGATKDGSTNSFNIVSNLVNAASTSGTFSAVGPSSPHPDAFIPTNTLLHVNQNDSQIPNLEDTAELRSTAFLNQVVQKKPSKNVQKDDFEKKDTAFCRFVKDKSTTFCLIRDCVLTTAFCVIAFCVTAFCLKFIAFCVTAFCLKILRFGHYVLSDFTAFCVMRFVYIRLPKDIYMLVNHIIEVKVIWNDIKMGDTRLTKDVCTIPKTNVLDSDSADMGNSNIIPYEQYVKHNEGLVIPGGESSVPNDACVMHENNAYVPDDSFNTTLNIYKDQDFKQKEMKLLNDFSRLKKLKNKIENKLYAQDQSIQTVHVMLKPKTLCDEHSEKDIVDPNRFHLKKAKTVQPTIYDGNEIFKPHHIPITVYDLEETLVIAETTRQKMSEKMDDPECVAKRVKIIPPNYLKENFLAMFTPQTQLNSKQVFWSLDLKKRKAKELKANTPPLRKLAAAAMSLPNTPAHLVPKTLPTKWSSKNLVTEVKKMKEIFKSMEAEVDQNVIDLRSGEIERKNLPIINENLIAKCIAQDVFYTVTNSALTASRFHELSIAYNVAKTRLVENSVSPTPYVPPSKKDYEILFQQLFDEYFNPLPRTVSPVLAAVAAPRVVDPAGSPSSTTIDQDVPSAKHPSDMKVLTMRMEILLEPTSNKLLVESSTVVSPIPIHKVHIDHPKDQILGDPKSTVQTRRMAKKSSGAHAFMEPKKVAQAFDDENWVKAMQEELMQFSLHTIWRLVGLPYGKKAIGTKWVQKEKIDYDEVFAPVARIEAIKIFLAFASFMRFIAYQMDVKSAFLYGTIEDEVYVSQPPSFIDSQFPNKVYKIENALYGLHQAPRVYVDDIIIGSTKKYLCDEFEALMHKRIQMSSIGELTFLLGCRFQVTPKLSHLHAVKRIFRNLKGQPKLGLWRLISWQCKKQTIIATSTTKAKYVATTNCCRQVLDLENVKTARAKEIASLKKRVTKLEQRQSSKILGFHLFGVGTSKRHRLGIRKVSKQGRKNLKSQQMFQDSDDVLDEDVEIEMVVEDKGNGEKGGSTAETVSTARPKVSTAEPNTPPTTATLFDDEDVTIADTLTERERQKAASKDALAEMYDEVHTQIYADHELAVRLTHEEQEKYTVKERSKLSEEDKKRIGSRKKRAAGGSDDDKAIDYETLDDKRLIVDCESQVLGTNEAGDVHVYKLTRLDGSYRHFSTFFRMLEVLHRQDVLDLHKIIMESFPANDPEEKMYPLTKEILKNMLSSRLEAETKSLRKPSFVYIAVDMSRKTRLCRKDTIGIMSSITAQQAKLDLDLIPKEKRLKIQKYNERLNPGKIQREPTFQVVLDALALTPCYSAFLITTDVPEVYMHQFWDSVYRHDTFYIFKMDKRKRFKLNMEILRDIFKIFPRVQGQDFNALPTDEKIMSFLRELGHTGEINSLNDVVIDQMHQPCRTFAALINSSLSGKTISLDKLQPTKKLKRVKRSTKNSTKAPVGGVVIRETPKMPLSKKKEKVDVTRGNGIDLLSEAALTEEAYVAKIKPSATNEGTGVKPWVLDLTKEESSKSEAKSWGNDEDDRNNEQDSRSEGSDEENDSDDKNTQSDNEKGLDSEHESNNENESDSEFDHQENEEEDEDDKEEEEDELVKNPSNDSDDEAKITDKAKGDEDEEMDYTTSQLYDDVDIRLNEPVQADDKTIQKEDIPHTDAKIVSPMDVHVHHEVPIKLTPTLLTVPVLVITKSSPIYSTIIPQSIPSFTPPPPQSTPTPPPTTEVTNPPSTLPNFASILQFNNRVATLEKEVVELKKDGPLKTQVTALVDEHPNVRLGATKDEFMNFLLTMVTKSLNHAILAKESSQPQSSYEPAAMLIEFKLKKILIEKIDKSESYLAALEHKECYEGLIKSYDLDKTLFSTYDQVYSLKRSQKDKYKDKDPSAGSDRGLKKRKTSKDAESKKEPKGKVASERDWFTKPKRPQEPTNPNWNDRKTPQQGPTQCWLMTLASSANKPSKTFDELMSNPIDFSAYIMNSPKITNLTQETLLEPAFRLLKGTHSNYAVLEYDFEECYKALLEKLDWENPEGDDYPFDLTKPLPLVISRNRQKVPVDYFFNTNLKYLQGGILIMIYVTSLMKTKAIQYDLLSIEDMV
nr:hypothetical protein [Tanacetum cinerariifolium]